MVVPDFNFRIRADRALYVVGEFNDDLLRQLIPRITELRYECKDPISVVISSHGGDVPCLDAIIAALSVHDQDGGECRVISYVNGHAASCGAILLTMADYAIATSSSKIHFHGIRYREFDLTTELAAQISTNISKENSVFADNMARAMMPRLMHRYSRLKKQIDSRRKKKRKPIPIVLGFADLIQEMLAPSAQKVFTKAANRLVRVRLISSTLWEVKFSRTDTIAQRDEKLLRHVLKYDAKEDAKNGLELDENGVGQVMFDYLMIRDFHFGDHMYSMESLVNIWGPEFLDEKKLKKYNQLDSSSKIKAFKFLEREVSIVVQDFWYLTVSLARNLLYGENTLHAWDAYWMGIIDEISGDNDCFGIRAMMEKPEPNSGSSMKSKPTGL